MESTPHHLAEIEELERDWIPALKNLLRWELLEEFKYHLWDLTGWHERYDPYILGDEATEQQKCEGWEMDIRIKQIQAKVLLEEHQRLVWDIERDQADGLEVFYRQRRE